MIKCELALKLSQWNKVLFIGATSLYKNSIQIFTAVHHKAHACVAFMIYFNFRTNLCCNPLCSELNLEKTQPLTRKSAKEWLFNLESEVGNSTLATSTLPIWCHNNMAAHTESTINRFFFALFSWFYLIWSFCVVKSCFNSFNAKFWFIT